MAAIQVSVIDAANRVVTEGELERAVEALQLQVRRDFAPIWGIDADLSLVPAGLSPPPDAWWLVVLEHSDQAAALGFHDLTPEGLPLGKVFAGTAKRFGDHWTVRASHALLEMLADPGICLTTFTQCTARAGVLVAREVCDPCGNDAFGYAIDGVTVSDFVYPAWFESFRNGDAQFDRQGQIREPFGLLAGGHLSQLELGAPAGWQQRAAPDMPPCFRLRPPVGSRRERRRTPRDQWLRSHPK